MGHRFTLADEETGIANRDQTRLEDARQRLVRFANEFFVYQHDDFRPLFRPYVGRLGLVGLQAAAEEVLSAYQSSLLVLESPVEPRLAKELTRDRFQAITALIYDRGHKHAKETLLSLTGGAPLTICMGDVCRIGGIRNRQTVTTTVGELSFCVKGCRAIFPDVVRTNGGKMWPGLCHGCRNAHRRPPRDQGRALVARVNALRRGKDATVYEWRLTLPDG